MPRDTNYPLWRDRFDYYVTYQTVQTFTVGVNASSSEEALELYPFVEYDSGKPSTIHLTDPVQINTIVESNEEYNNRWTKTKGRMSKYGYQ